MKEIVKKVFDFDPSKIYDILFNGEKVFIEEIEGIEENILIPYDLQGKNIAKGTAFLEIDSAGFLELKNLNVSYSR